MSENRSSYEDRFRRRLDTIQAGAWERLEQIGTFPPEAARALLREILETGCLAQNAANILLGREALARLLAWWVGYARRLNDPGVKEAIQDYI